MRYVLHHPGETRPSLVVQTTPRADARAVASLRQAMYGTGCPNGLLFDEHDCVILRDHFVSTQPESIQEDRRVSTDAVLPKAQAGQLDLRVERWLTDMAGDWDHALPSEPDIASAFIPDIVSAVSGSLVQSQFGGEARL